ncbi:hypothetical protein [Xanthovirga aplysinae]|uniref:hypothetical protein n=1 Tax=Xanthovirga aplysinae TaxID=2529853 RepID=UPI0012BB87F4|nr:hypothetical protein [Xanthovirga aplysinae]MTI33045.1 hypothetical protein [Xanthovirga aplysinae]
MKTFFTNLLMLLFFSATYAQTISLKDVDPGDIKIQGFSLSTDGSININGTGSVLNDDWRLLVYYGWILDSDSRKVVWHLFDFMEDQDEDKLNGNFDFNTKVNLPKGNYELYFAAMHTNRNRFHERDSEEDGVVLGFLDAIDWVLSSRNKRKYRRSIQDDLFIQLEGRNLKPINSNKLFEDINEEAIISFTKIRNDNRLKQGFTISKETDIRIYALGEGRENEIFDYAWITDANTGKHVYEMGYSDSQYGGGDSKNLKIEETISLPAGSYLVNYSSDGSHSYEKWNALPPDDPQFYGISIWPASIKDKDHFVEFKKPKTMTPLVSLTKARDEEILSQGISIKKKMNVRIFGLGEEGHDGDLVDYGWIVNANSREKIWKMKTSRSNHAGGADKNRSVKAIISLDPGDYIVYYATDDSHSYRDWNSDKPYESEMWGITLWATEESDLRHVSTFDPKEFRSEDELAVITMVGNGALVKKTFSLEEDTKIRILALGEGTGGEMDDYGFIKNVDTGEIVWKMRYRESEHGGGARKNREFNESFMLEKGTYRVYFESDGSHSYARWNDDPPTNQELWGITVLKD